MFAPDLGADRRRDNPSVRSAYSVRESPRNVSCKSSAHAVASVPVVKRRTAICEPSERISTSMPRGANRTQHSVICPPRLRKRQTKVLVFSTVENASCVPLSMKSDCLDCLFGRLPGPTLATLFQCSSRSSRDDVERFTTIGLMCPRM